MTDTNPPANDALLVAIFADAHRARSAVAEMRTAGRPATSLGILSPSGGEGDMWLGRDDATCRSKRASGMDGGAALALATVELDPIGRVLAAGFFVNVLARPGAERGHVRTVLATIHLLDEAAYFERALCAGRTIVAARGADLGRGSQIVARHRARLGRLYRGASDGIRGRTVVSAM